MSCYFQTYNKWHVMFNTTYWGFSYKLSHLSLITVLWGKYYYVLMYSFIQEMSVVSQPWPFFSIQPQGWEQKYRKKYLTSLDDKHNIDINKYMTRDFPRLRHKQLTTVLNDEAQSQSQSQANGRATALHHTVTCLKAENQILF